MKLTVRYECNMLYTTNRTGTELPLVHDTWSIHSSKKSWLVTQRL